MVSRAAAHWNIFLPFGSDDGPYDIRLLAGSENYSFDKSRREIDRRRCCDSDIGGFVLPFPWAVCFRLTRNGSQESSYVVELR